MLSLDCPRLRPSVNLQPDRTDDNLVWLYDAARLTPAVIRLPRAWVPLLGLFDGRSTVTMMAAAVRQAVGRDVVSADFLLDLARHLDEAMLLEGPRLEAHLRPLREAPVREPACIGCYEAEPVKLREQLRRLFDGPRGPGEPGPLRADDRLRAALIPHIDYRRGGATYAHGFKEVVERSDATVFVIIGTSHYGPRHRFVLTRKHFRTPLGVIETDQGYVDRLAEIWGERAFADELLHLPEHSIELHAVLLQCLLEGRRPFRIVPLLVGSFADCVVEGTAPDERPDVHLMVQALRRAEAACQERVFYLISGDLAHIGPKFDDPDPVHPEQLEHSKRQDQELLRRLAAGDRSGFFRVLHEEGDGRRICGFPPSYTLLAALAPDGGRLLDYDQYVAPDGHESVSFASMTFYKGGS
jgi:hypothetical protein